MQNEASEDAEQGTENVSVGLKDQRIIARAWSFISLEKFQNYKIKAIFLIEMLDITNARDKALSEQVLVLQKCPKYLEPCDMWKYHCISVLQYRHDMKRIL